MILSFKKEFVPKILAGTKIHTIREDKPNRWKVGNKIHFATSVRTKNYNCFKEGECLFIQDIHMSIDESIYKYSPKLKEFTIVITIGSKVLRAGTETVQFALNDGFSSYQEFHNWFYPLIIKTENRCFHGKLIHWTNKMYKY
jgi:uncharacterized protein YqfB (UPF0267 family)